MNVVDSFTSSDTITGFEELLVKDGATFNVGADVSAETFTVGEGASGTLNVGGNTVTFTVAGDAFVMNANSTFQTTINSPTANEAGKLIVTGSATIDAGSKVNVNASEVALVNSTTYAIVTSNSGTGTSVVINDVSDDNLGFDFTATFTDGDLVVTANTVTDLVVKDGETLPGKIDFTFDSVTVGEGSSGVLNQSAGTITSPTVAIAAGGTFTQSGTGVLLAGTDTITIATDGVLTLVNQGTGAIDGFGAGQGTLIFGGDYDTDAALGAGNSLASIVVSTGTLTLDQSLNATLLTISGVLNKSSSNGITATTTINDGGTLDVRGNTVNVTGNFDMAANATFRVTINSGTANASGKLIASGTATIPASGTIIVDTESVVLAPGTKYLIVDGSANGAVVAPLAVVDNSTGFDFTLTTNGNDLFLTVASADLVPSTTTGLSSNTAAIREIVNAFLKTDDELAKAFLGLTTDEEIEAALQTLLPDASGAARNASFTAISCPSATIVNRISSLRTSANGMMTGVSAGDAYRERELSMWFQGFGHHRRPG